ncbi:MAG: TIGR03936 family radical SAM-associated protein [Christensenellales bacterium]|jgi:radical SAM-linked protein
MRALVRLEKTGAARYISHLDLQRSFHRAIRRAGLPIAYSQGFNPRMLVSYATALSLGLESRCEIMELKLTKDVSPAFIMESLNLALPEGIRISGCRKALEKSQSLSSIIMRAGYEAAVFKDCSSKVKAFLGLESCPVEKRSKRGIQEVDIRPMVFELSFENDPGEGGIIKMLLEHTPTSSLNPQLLLEAMEAPPPWRITRTGLYTLVNQQTVDIWKGEGII